VDGTLSGPNLPSSSSLNRWGVPSAVRKALGADVGLEGAEDAAGHAAGEGDAFRQKLLEAA